MAGSGKASVISRTARLLVRAVRAGLTPSLVSYFFWISGFTTLFGAFTMISFTPLSDYLCNIPGEMNETSGHTVGCANCSDSLMLCGRAACWRYAFNLSYQLNAKTPDGQLYGAFQEAVLDQACNSLVVTADSPVNLLNSIIAQRAKTANAEPSEACVSWNCKVMTMALMRSTNTMLTRPGACTNELGVKPPWEDTLCACDNTAVTMQEAADFISLCGSMSEGLQEAVYNRMITTKDQCFQSSMDAAALIAPAEYSATIIEVNCFSLLGASSSLPEWFDRLAYVEALVPQPAGWEFMAYCRKVYCNAYVASLSNSACNWATSENLGIGSTQPNIDIVDSFCQPEGFDLTQAFMCSNTPFNTTAYCTPGGGRRLAKRPLEPLALGKALPRQRAAALPQVTVKPREAEVSHHALQEAMVGADGSLEGMTLAEEADTCEGDVCSSQTRRLTAAAAAATNNDALQDWTVTPWSKCTCYQQCTPGVTTRSVSCPAGVQCKEPKPTSAKSCVCKHCSDCDVLLFVLGTAAAYGFTGFLCGLLWLAFTAVSMFEEDDYTGMSMSLKCLGCFCKFLPNIIKIMTYTTLFFIILLVVTALVPIGAIFSDCKNSTSMNQLAIGGVAVWFVQLSVGVYMHRFKPMPPWLHTAPSSKAMKLLCKPFKCVGP